MRKVIQSFIASSAVLVLAACATATPYIPVASDGHGYKSQKLESDRFRVSFKGNSRTEKDTVRNYLLYRAAELTLANGGDYFVLTSKDTNTDVEQSSTVVGSPFLFSGFRFGTGFGGTVVNSSMEEYEASAVFVIKDGDKPANNSAAYDARQVKDNLEATIKRPE